jgi:hypothetical protein
MDETAASGGATVRRAGLTAVCTALAAGSLAVGAVVGAGADLTSHDTARASAAHVAARASSYPACRPPGSRTLAADARVRVYSLAGSTAFQASVHACLLSNRRTVALGVRGLPQVRIGPLALSGTLLAYASRTIGIDTSSASVSELDLAASRPLLSSAPAASPPTRPESFTSVTDLQITARGSVAWIARTSGVLQPVPIFEVREQLRARAPRLLARGAAVRPGSLRLQHGRVGWIEGSRAAGAPLP